MKKVLFFIALMLFNLSFSQSSSLSGKVTDAKGEAVVGANVMLNNTAKSTSTNADGVYTFSGLSDGDATVTVSYIGFATEKKTTTINGKTTKTESKRLTLHYRL